MWELLTCSLLRDHLMAREGLVIHKKEFPLPCPYYLSIAVRIIALRSDLSMLDKTPLQHILQDKYIQFKAYCQYLRGQFLVSSPTKDLRILSFEKFKSKAKLEMFRRDSEKMLNSFLAEKYPVLD